MGNTALVTGASAGIGEAIARYHASKGGNLVLVARRKESLEALKADLEKQHKISVLVVPADLTKPSSTDEIYNVIEDHGWQIDILINNAGYGGQGIHIERDVDTELGMIDLNVKALVSLTHRFAKDMVARGSGKILNVGSLAGFMPGPNQAVYFATKAFVNSFSQAMDQELRDKGVTCTVLTPGYVETEFAARADLEGTEMVNQGGDTPQSVAKIGYDAMLDGKLVVFNNTKYALLVNLIVPFLPRRMLLKMAQKSQSKL